MGEIAGGLFFLFGVCSGVGKSVEMWKKSGNILTYIDLWCIMGL